VTVVRADGSLGTVSVNYATTTVVPPPGQDSATPGADYTATSGTLTFAEGEVSKTITIPILDDNLYELTEVFNVTLSNPTGGAILDFKFVTQVGIMDNEPQSKISIADTSVIEGNSGTTYARFPITITPAAGFPITVNLKTGCCESATENEDYQMITGSVTFAPGESLKTFDVPVFGDTKYERDEVFGASIVSFSPENTISITNFGAHATIVNDDVGKVTCTPSASTLEGPAGTTKSVEITCTADSPFAGGVYYKTADGTAHAAEQDYMFASGSIVFNPGFPTAKFSVTVIGDNTIEPDEQFTINLQADPAEGWNFVVEPASIPVTILNDDTPGVVTCIDTAWTEGNKGTSDARISCFSPTPVSGTIDFATRNGTAVAPVDYQATTGTLTFENETTKSFTVAIAGDTEVEPDETFTIDLTPHPSALNPFTLGRNSVVVTILNDDQPPPPPQVVLAPGRLFMTLGDNVPVRASIEPPSSTETILTLTVQDPSVVDTPTAVVVSPNQPAFFPVTAKKLGSTAIIVTAGTGITGTLLLADVAEGKPTLTSLEPASGPTTGGVTVSLKGTNLTTGCLVSVGGMPATSLVFSSPTAATFIAPAHTAGNVDVTLTCGSSTSTLSNAFTYASVRGRAARH
jgi:chitinase